MKAKAFVPGHISCVFRPFRTDDPLTTGSKGFGFRLDKGCTATVWERDDDKINICINGKRCDAEITRAAIESMCPGHGLEIRLKHDLPLEQGFGASASGTYAATLCAADILGMDRKDAAIATHTMECTMGGGLGDLLAMDSEYPVPVRDVPGAPGVTGKVSDSGIDPGSLTVVVFKEPLKTGTVLSDNTLMEKISIEGDAAIRMLNSMASMEGLFKASNHFSESTGLESDEIRTALCIIRDAGHEAGMCMLGNSIFTTASADEMKEMFPSAAVISCGTYSGKISVSRI